MNESRYYYEGNQLITEVNDYRGIITRFDFHYDQRGILSGFNYRGEQHRGTFYYLRDMMLNIIGIVDENGRRICEYRYNDSRGNHDIINIDNNQLSRIVAQANPFRYKGYYFDYRTGYYYLESRYYDPVIRRFISADDVSFLAPEEYSGINLFVYCLNNPVMYFDSSGNFVISLKVAIIIGFIVAGGTAGGLITYNIAYKSGARSWQLAAWTALGVFAGATIGLAAGIYIAPYMATFATKKFVFGSGLSFGMTGGVMVTSGGLVISGSQVLAGTTTLGLLTAAGLVRFASTERPGNNRDQNEQMKAAVRELGHNPNDPKVKDRIRRAHHYIRKNRLKPGWEELLDILVDFLF